MERSRSFLPGLLLRLALAVALVAWLGASAAGQRRVVRAGLDADTEAPPENNFPAPSREILQDLGRAREALDHGRYAEALQRLQKILGPDAARKPAEDFFYQPDKKVPIFRSLKAEAHRLIGEMPREGHDLYELKCGGDARQMLQEAMLSRDPARMAAVSALYFHTQAGYEATFLLGLYHLDHGSPLEGALMLQRLRESPDGGDRFEPALTLAMSAGWVQGKRADDARRALAGLKQRRSGLSLNIAGQKVTWFDRDEDAVAWLTRWAGPQRSGPRVESDRWAMHRGDPARNASTTGSPPLLNLRWRIPITDSDVVDDVLRHLEQSYRERNLPLVSGLHPLVVDDIVLMRTARNLLAVDFATGKRLWEIPTDDPLEGLGGQANAESLARQVNPMAMLLGQRIWDDATYGTLSSDGRLVYSIEDLGLGAVSSNSNMGVAVFVGGVRNGNSQRGLSNRLVATEIRTGKRKWEFGGPSGRSGANRSEMFFLGPPLPLRGQLFVLAEINDEIRLLALESSAADEPNQAAKVLWSQQLAMVERNVDQEPLRRLAGISPSYADGILICPTGAGAVVAVDLATRSLLWGYRFAPDKDGSNPERQQQLMAIRFGMYQNMAPVPRWLDGTATLVDGRVLVTPAESDALYCLNLIDGKPAWDAVPRQDDLYVASVNNNTIVLVGRQKVRALRLSDGKPAWDGRTVSLPANAVVTGRGFASGNQYYVPVSTAEVVTIDMEAGKTTHVAKSRKGDVPGNMVCYKGKVISQGLTSLETFYQVDAAQEEIKQRLAARPDDAEAVSLQGEILLDADKFTEAVASFRRAYELDKDSETHLRTRELLRDALMDGLRTDFPTHRKYAEEVERLLDDPVQRAAYLRLMAVGLQQSGQWHAALGQYLKLIDLDQPKGQLEAVDRVRSVRRDRWIQAALADFRPKADPEAAAELDRALQEQLREARESTGTEALRRFVEYFGHQPAEPEARRELVKRLAAAGRILDAELALWPDRRSADRGTAGAALGEMAEVFAQAGRHDAAAVCYQQLAAEFADVACRDGKTGRQLLAALPEEGPIRRLLGPGPVWPAGQVESPNEGKGRVSRAEGWGRFFVPLQGSPGPFYAKTMVRFDQNKQVLLGYDDLGREQWQAPLSDAGRRMAIGYNPNMCSARVQGHLLLLSVGTRVMGIDPSGPTGSKLLWSQDLNDPTTELAGRGHVVVNGQIMILNGLGAFQSPFESGVPVLGPVTENYACFLRFRNVVAINPLTGASLWVRRDIPANSDIFGDDQYVFVLPPNQNEALVLRALDGELLGKRAVPRPSNRGNSIDPFADGLERTTYNTFQYTGMQTLGRYVLTWQQDGDRRTLDLFDPWEQRPLWPTRKFAAKAKAALVGSEAIGVLEPDGHFVLVALPDGRTIADVQVEAEPSLSEIIVTRLGEQYFLVTHDARVRARQNQHPIQPLPGMLGQPIRRGRLYALDLRGKLAWPSPVMIEDQHFLLNQAAGLPLLAFACQRYDQRNNGQMTVKTCLLCVDRRNGRVIHNEDYPNAAMTLDVIGDPERKTVELRMQTNTVVLKFTDTPFTTAAVRSNVKPVQGKLTEALWRALEDTLTKEPEEEPAPPQKAAPPKKVEKAADPAKAPR